jgi:hypothetical protein
MQKSLAMCGYWNVTGDLNFKSHLILVDLNLHSCKLLWVATMMGWHRFQALMFGGQIMCYWKYSKVILDISLTCPVSWWVMKHICYIKKQSFIGVVTHLTNMYWIWKEYVNEKWYHSISMAFVDYSGSSIPISSISVDSNISEIFWKKYSVCSEHLKTFLSCWYSLTI